MNVARFTDWFTICVGILTIAYVIYVIATTELWRRRRLQQAKGEALRLIGLNVGVTQMKGESEQDFRKRMIEHIANPPHH